ncbi:MAG TPA: hypothetical protein VJ246_02165 [Patescibacteria group bacterium]|nr:hypothetical protein [Patescibacteria group bacterium]
MSTPKENPIETAYWDIKAQNAEASLEDVFALLVASKQFPILNLNTWLTQKKMEIAEAQRMLRNAQSLEETIGF